jgi:hypothetical protein
MNPIRSAVDAIAASHCLLARRRREGGKASHPGPCTFCPEDAAAIGAAIAEFWAWDGSTHAVEIWEGTAPMLQLRRLREAQGYRPGTSDLRSDSERATRTVGEAVTLSRLASPA